MQARLILFSAFEKTCQLFIKIGINRIPGARAVYHLLNEVIWPWPTKSVSSLSSPPDLYAPEAQKESWKKEILNYDWHDSRLFGYNWGDPDEAETRELDGRILGNYLKIKKDYLIPMINGCTVLEIGSGGGKWTRYMLGARRIICVDLDDVFFDYIKSHMPYDNITFYKTSGNELYGIEDHSVDFIFSMDALPRAPKNVIFDYFKEFARVLRLEGKMCLHLPCRDMAGSVERRFLDLSRNEIQNLCVRNGFKQFEIDDQTIKHGIILRVNYV